jgi:KaiB domain
VELIITPSEPAIEPPVFAMVDAADKRRFTPQSSRRTTSGKPSSTTGGDGDKPAIELVLYVSSVSAHSTTALRNLRRALANFAEHPVRLTVHDLSKDPQRAERDGVHFTPTLVTKSHGPKTWIVGHLGNPQVLQALLEAALEPSE